MIAEYIKILIAAGWTQRKIAFCTGIPAPNISRILAGRQKDVYFEHGRELEKLALMVKKSSK